MRSRLEVVLDRLEAQTGKRATKSGEGFVTRCPAHDDQTPSLSLRMGDDGRALVNCHAGCTPQQVVGALGLTMADLFVPSKNAKSRIVATYAYRDEKGAVLFQVVRYEPKKFVQRRLVGGEKVYRLGDVRRVLYRLPELIAANPELPVYVVEGEKDADRLASLGLVATTNPQGAGKWRADYNEALRGRHVVILPDNDDVGRTHAEAVARSLDGVAAGVKVLRLDVPEKGDVSEWLDTGGTREKLEALVAEAPVWEPARVEVANDDFVTAADLLAEPDERIPWLVDGMLNAGGSSLSIAKPKVGKSTMARNLGAAVATGTPFLGRATARGTVLYCAFEEKRGDVKRHLRALQAADGFFVYVGPVPAEPFAWLRSAIQKHAAVLVIIDTLGRLMRARDLNSYAETTKLTGPLLTLAHETGAHIHCLHHAGKGERQGIDAALGSTALTGFVDTVLVLKRHGYRTRTLETIQRTGTDLAETVVALDKDTGRVTLGGLLEDDRIADVIRNVVAVVGPDVRTEEQIREAVGGDRGITGKAIRRAFKDELLVRDGRGTKGDPFRYYRTDEEEREGGCSTGKREKRENENPVGDDARFSRLPVSSFTEPHTVETSLGPNGGGESPLRVPNGIGRGAGGRRCPLCGEAPRKHGCSDQALFASSCR